jgi:hypothetical protein
MRLHRGVPVLASILTLVATSTPAYGFVGASGRGPSSQPTAVAQHHSDDSIDWVIRIGAAGAVTMLATGLPVARRRHTPPAPRRARTAS